MPASTGGAWKGIPVQTTAGVTAPPDWKGQILLNPFRKHEAARLYCAIDSVEADLFRERPASGLTATLACCICQPYTIDSDGT